jgi:hypothetical protein
VEPLLKAKRGAVAHDEASVVEFFNRLWWWEATGVGECLIIPSGKPTYRDQQQNKKVNCKTGAPQHTVHIRPATSANKPFQSDAPSTPYYSENSPTS